MPPDMHLSAFNLYVEDYPAQGEILVHNTYSGSFVVLDTETMEALRRRDRGVELTPRECELIDDEELSDPDVGIVVSSLAAENQDYLDWFRQRNAARTLSSIVGLNLACNFECSYCCQADFMDGSVMKPAVATRTAAWLASRAIEIDADRAHVTFVGGEPLLHPDRIKAIAAHMRARLDPHGIDLTIGLITNGYFLTEELVQELRPYGLTAAKVTLDGDDTTHHLTRISKRGENTFTRIFDNVIRASRHIQIAINGNYQESTISGFGPMIARLAEAGLPGQTPFGLTPALEVMGAPTGSGSGSCTWSESAFGYRVALHDEVLRHGFRSDPLNRIGPCAFHAHHMYAIDPDGNIFKCPGFLGYPEWRIGDVVGGLTERYEQMLDVPWSRSCGGCAHQPNCAGGCLAAEFINSGTTGGVNCEKTYFDSIQRDAVVRTYLLASTDDPERARAAFPAPPVALPPPRSRSRPARGLRPPGLRVV